MATRDTQILKMRDMMKVLNRSRPEINKLIAEGRLKCFRLRPRGERLFHVSEIDRFVESLFDPYREN